MSAEALARDTAFECWEIALGDVPLTADRSGVLIIEDAKTLVVADLHLEKGTARARHRSFLPPYDTRTTLARLKRAIDRLSPARIVALGDSFHDVGGCERMSPEDRQTLTDLQRGVEWIWIAGNHDPVLPAEMKGERRQQWSFRSLTFCHEPTLSGQGEIAGHLHPCARVDAGGRCQRRPCFVASADRLLMPAFGAYTGGLNVLDPAITTFFGAAPAVAVLGKSGIYPVSSRQLRADT